MHTPTSRPPATSETTEEQRSRHKAVAPLQPAHDEASQCSHQFLSACRPFNESLLARAMPAKVYFYSRRRAATGRYRSISVFCKTPLGLICCASRHRILPAKTLTMTITSRANQDIKHPDRAHAARAGVRERRVFALDAMIARVGSGTRVHQQPGSNQRGKNGLRENVARCSRCHDCAGTTDPCPARHGHIPVPGATYLIIEATTNDLAGHTAPVQR